MCAVRVRKQFNCETNRRQQWQLFVVLVVLPLTLLRLDVAGGADVALTIPTPWPDAAIDDCHDDYMQASANASRIFNKTYELCELTANETKIDLTINGEEERAQIELGRNTVCGNFEECNQLDATLDYLECVKKSGSDNLQLITEINHNATSAHTRLREDYNELEKSLMLCYLGAQVVYVNSMREAYEELQQCRIELNDVQN